MSLTFPAIALNIGADLQSMGAVVHLVVPTAPMFVFSVPFTGPLLVTMV